MVFPTRVTRAGSAPTTTTTGRRRMGGFLLIFAVATLALAVHFGQASGTASSAKCDSYCCDNPTPCSGCNCALVNNGGPASGGGNPTTGGNGGSNSDKCTPSNVALNLITEACRKVPDSRNKYGYSAFDCCQCKNKWYSIVEECSTFKGCQCTTGFSSTIQAQSQDCSAGKVCFGFGDGPQPVTTTTTTTTTITAAVATLTPTYIAPATTLLCANTNTCTYADLQDALDRVPVNAQQPELLHADPLRSGDYELAIAVVPLIITAGGVWRIEDNRMEAPNNNPDSISNVGVILRWGSAMMHLIDVVGEAVHGIGDANQDTGAQWQRVDEAIEQVALSLGIDQRWFQKHTRSFETRDVKRTVPFQFGVAYSGKQFMVGVCNGTGSLRGIVKGTVDGTPQASVPVYFYAYTQGKTANPITTTKPSGVRMAGAGSAAALAGFTAAITLLLTSFL